MVLLVRACGFSCFSLTRVYNVGQGSRCESEHFFSDSDSDDDNADDDDSQEDNVEPSPGMTIGTSSSSSSSSGEENREEQQRVTVSFETASIAPHSDDVGRKKTESGQPFSVLVDKGGGDEGGGAGGGEREW